MKGKTMLEHIFRKIKILHKFYKNTDENYLYINYLFIYEINKFSSNFI